MISEASFYRSVASVGVLYLADIFWFAWSGSNIDYCMAWVVGIFIGAVIGSIRWRK